MSRDYRSTVYPSDTMEVCQENLDLFFNFINERHLIWHRRFIDKLPKEQWTNDPILKVTKYTNVYRELDRGTLWWLDNIGIYYSISSDIDYSFKRLVWQTIIYRLCNRIETFEETGIPDFNTYDSSKIENDFWAKLKIINERGDPVMTSAHLSCPTPAGYFKFEGFVMAVNDLHKNLDSLVKEIKIWSNPKNVFESLMSIFCVGNFIAYEVLCDLMLVKSIGRMDEHNVFIPFKEDDWANVGPGAIEGIRMIYPSTKGKKAIYERMVQLRDEQSQHFERLGIKFKHYEKFTSKHLSLRSIEHSCCEFQKFWLQRKSLGKQRLKLVPDNNRIVNKIEDGKEVKYKIIVDPNTGDSLKKVYL